MFYLRSTTPFKVWRSRTRFSWPLALLMAGLVAAVGGVYIYVSHAATNVASTETESGMLSGNAASTTDATASGGHAVKFSPVKNIGSRGFGMSTPRLASQTTVVQEQWLADMQSMGITWVRFDIDWWTVQPNNATSYDWSKYDTTVALAKKYGMQVDGIVSYSAPWARSSQCAASFQCVPADMNVYATYAKAVVVHFGDSLGAVEIWNEPNVQGFWQPAPNPAAYATMLKLAYAAVKSANPHMLVISAGLAPAASDGTNVSPIDFVTQLYTNGAKSYFDVLGHHPYSYPAPPSDPQAWSGWSQMSETNPSIRSVMVANGDISKKVWMTEVGAPTGGPGGLATCSNYNYGGGADHVDDCLQQQILTEVATKVKATDWAGVVFFYSYKDDGTASNTVENFFGVVRNDGTHKPSYDALKQTIQAP